ncbi:sensor histidine kinase [Halanaerobaculum tunisiense]
MNNLSKSKLFYIIIILLVQSFLLLLVTTWRNISFFNITGTVILEIILFIAVGLSILSIIMIKELSKIINSNIQQKIKTVKLQEKEKLIKNLRRQKHDFSNHLQTIYGMVQLEKKDEVLDYITSLNQDLQNLQLNKTKGDNDNFSGSILDSILVPKQEEAQEKGIDLEYWIDADIEAVNLELNKVFRVLYNLVDNAVEAVESSNEELKIVMVRGKKKEPNKYQLAVYNTGSPIDQEMLDHIFAPGFSNKGSDRGYGLYIIKSIVDQGGGQIEVKSEEQFGTEFICHLPVAENCQN